MEKPNKFIHHFAFDEISSTMIEAANKVDEGYIDGLLVTARHQTLGRGRNGKSFSSPKDLGLWVTLGIALKDGAPPFQQIKTFSVALCALLNEEYNIDAKIKWPNDIYTHQKKICGLLAEWHKNRKTLLLGFGLNVNQTNTDWGSSLIEIACSMHQQTNKKYSLIEVLQDVLLAYEEAQKQDQQTIDDLYKKYSLLWGTYALLNGKKVYIKEINAEGALIVGESNITETIYAGDLLPIR